MRGAEARAAGLERYDFFLACAGRGAGKTKTGSETTIEEARELREVFRGALVARTAADVRDVIIGGESGIMACSDPSFRPRWEPSNRRIVWPNGAVAITYSADEPDQLRGPQQNYAWGDEVAAWRFPDAYDQLMMGLRLRPHPRAVFTTTPRPTRLVRDLLSDPRTMVMRGSTYDNAENLAPSYLASVRRKYEGTTLGRQELHAEVMDEAPGALWRRALFRRCLPHEIPELDRIVIAVDPSATANDDSDEAGIIAAGSYRVKGVVHAVVLYDYSAKLRPHEWAARAVEAYDAHHADRLVAEVNNGGDMVEDLARMTAAEMRRLGKRPSGEVAYRSVHATEGKRTRAEPVVALYEQGRVTHVVRPAGQGYLGDLEDQCCTWVPGKKSPDRMDAMVWALTELVINAENAAGNAPMSLGFAAQARPSRMKGV